MNADLILSEVIAQLERRYGRAARLGKSRLFSFGSALSCSINYSRLLGGHKYFFGLARDVADPTHSYPPTEFGDFVLLVCGSSETVLVLPRYLTLEAMIGVISRRIDLVVENGTYILQTTKHPKLNVTEFLNAYPKATRLAPQNQEGETSHTGLPDRVHLRIQWELVQLGRAEGCSVWVPPLDRNLSYQGRRLDEATLGRLPQFGFDENARRIVQNIDVLWLTRNVIHKAFEIESTTTIYSGLLRLNDLVLAQPNNQIELFIAADRSKKDRVHVQLVRPTFQPLIDRCQFLPFEFIDEQAKRLDALPSGARVSGLLRGETFSLPEHYVYPTNV